MSGVIDYADLSREKNLSPIGDIYGDSRLCCDIG